MQGKNRLAKEKSPYLLQHAQNPVDWFPWSEEAFQKAAAENKPIFLSIGYSTCHWCHVMAHESFEDPEVARLLNDAFVSIKVDREERPDIDLVYMNVCQMLTGSGGWPLSVFLTPDKKPFYAGTYFPRETRFGRIGMLDLIPRIKGFWISKKGDLVNSAEEIVESLKLMSGKGAWSDPGKSVLEAAYQGLVERYDEMFGGFGFAPKFPSPHNLSFLLRWWWREKKEAPLDMVEKTLEAMRCGGIFDQIGFGFHRYSVDQEWLVPHFEKMLYDQALISMVYVEAYQATGKETYRLTAEEVFAYVLRDLRDPSGAFYASEDADSEGEEGKFYLWTEEEIRQALSHDEAEDAFQFFRTTQEGNFADEASGRKTGKNILHLFKGWRERFDQHRFNSIREKLLRARNRRIRPHLDDKILTDWNGLMIASLAKAARAFGTRELADAAEKAASFIVEKLCSPSGFLLHRYRDGEGAISGHLSDYVFFIWGLIELYETTFKQAYLEKAILLNDYLLKHFWDEKDGGFFSTANNEELVLVRMKDVYDGAIPSGNSAAMLNFFRLSRLYRDSLEEKGWGLARAFSYEVSQAPFAYTHFMVALDFALSPVYEVTISGDSSSPETKKMLQALGKAFVPNKVVFFRDNEEGKPVASICSAGHCELPTTEISKMLEILLIPGTHRSDMEREN